MGTVSVASLGASAQAQIREQLGAGQKTEKAPKFRNASQVVDGYRHASTREAARWMALRAEEARGEITDLRHQPAWRLEVNGVLIADYIADASYRRNGALVVEDVKSAPTRKLPEFRMKMKLMQALYRIHVVEVE